MIGKIFERIPGTRIVKEMQSAETSWFGVPIVCSENNYRFNKKNVVKFLEDNGIQTRNYFAGNLLMHPAYKGIDDPLKYPNASKVLEKVFFVGCSPVITKEMINHIEYLITIFLEET